MYKKDRRNAAGKPIPYTHQDWDEQEQKTKIDALRVLVGVVVGAKHW